LFLFINSVTQSGDLPRRAHPNALHLSARKTKLVCQFAVSRSLGEPPEELFSLFRRQS
jgi:hypothetical protein